MGYLIPKQLKKSELKAMVETNYPGSKVVFVNYCYKIDKFIKLTS